MTSFATDPDRLVRSVKEAMQLTENHPDSLRPLPPRWQVNKVLTASTYSVATAQFFRPAIRIARISYTPNVPT